ncbi:MAG: SAM-dependent methyltransferase [Gammaproteobacteria bacterium]|nr:MAG: SAM-dependent methyltransferase [Gammaproteobacteria bacterium]
MDRVPEPELMDEAEQARAYAEADFSEPNTLFLDLFRTHFTDLAEQGAALDLGCGPADISVRFAAEHPRWTVDAVDGAENMLVFARDAVVAAGLEDRVRPLQGFLPSAAFPRASYEAILCNSLLHHLNDPLDLWRTIMAAAAPGAAVLVMDLLRPMNEREVDHLVATHAADAPLVLQRDFRCSLFAAYREQEVRDQLNSLGLSNLSVSPVSDRHLAVAGRFLPG